MTLSHLCYYVNLYTMGWNYRRKCSIIYFTVLNMSYNKWLQPYFTFFVFFYVNIHRNLNAAYFFSCIAALLGKTGNTGETFIKEGKLFGWFFIVPQHYLSSSRILISSFLFCHSCIFFIIVFCIFCIMQDW